MRWLWPLLALLPLAASAKPATIKVTGSDSMLLLTERWRDEVAKRDPELSVKLAGGGTTKGIHALLSGMTDLAAASRKMKGGEKDKLRGRFKTPPTEIPVARDGVVFFVHQDNPVGALTKEQLARVFKGELTRWSELGGADAPITVLAREESSGTYAFVQEALLGDGDHSPRARRLAGTLAVVNAVAKDKHAIGYGGVAYGQGVRQLKIKVGEEEVAATAADVKTGRYPLSRDLYLYARVKPSGAVKRFVDFVLSEEGQAQATAVGYFPVR